MSLESTQPRHITSFLIKDILASNEESNISETALYKDSLSSKIHHTSSVEDSEQDSSRPFPFSDSRIRFGQPTGGYEVHRFHKDRSESKFEQDSTGIRFEHHVSTGKNIL